MTMKRFALVAALALVASFASAATISVVQKTAEDMDFHYTGDEIFSTGGVFQNSWTAGGTDIYSTTGSVMNITTTGTSQTKMLVGTSATDGGADTWQTLSNGIAFTTEVDVRVNSAPNGFRLWFGNSTEMIFVDLFTDKIVTTNAGGGLKTVTQVGGSNIDLSSGFHKIRVANGTTSNDVHIWLDGVVVSDATGGVYNSGTNDSRLLFGDSTSGEAFDSFNVDIASISYDRNNAYAPQTKSANTIWQTNWKEAGLAHDTTITDTNLDGDVTVGRQDVTVISGTTRVFNSNDVGGLDVISTTNNGTFEMVAEITSATYEADMIYTLDYVIGTGASSALDGDWYVEFGTMSGGVFTSADSESTGTITLTSSENFQDDVNDQAVLFGEDGTYNVGGRVLSFEFDPTALLEGETIAIRFGTTNSNLYAGFTDMQITSEVIPEPATMSLLALGGVAMLKRRKK